jgi:hypothetical protein
MYNLKFYIALQRSIDDCASNMFISLDASCVVSWPRVQIRGGSWNFDCAACLAVTLSAFVDGIAWPLAFAQLLSSFSISNEKST